MPKEKPFVLANSFLASNLLDCRSHSRVVQLIDQLSVDALANPGLGGKRDGVFGGHPFHTTILIGLYADGLVGGGYSKIRHVQVQMRSDVLPALLVPVDGETSSE